MLVVLEPRMKSVDTVGRMLRLAKDIEVGEVLAVGNKVSKPGEAEFIETHMEEMGVPVLTHIPFDEAVGEADMLGVPAIDHNPESPAVKAVEQLRNKLLAIFSS